MMPTTNAEFLAGIFGTLPDGIAPLICGFDGDPSDDGRKGKWSAWPWLPVVGAADHAAWNWYFTLGAFQPNASGQYRRRNNQRIAIHGVMLDDLGTKVDAAKLAALPPSTWVETSAGNFQAIYLFREPVTDLAAADALQGALLAAGLSDSGATGAGTRNCRMPFAVNGKHSPPHQCRLAEWRPDRRYAIDEIVQGFGLQLQPPCAARRTQATRTDHLWDSKSPAEQARVVEDLRSALAHMPSDDRSEWVAVAFALRTLPDEIGLPLFLEWSATSTKYDEDYATDTYLGAEPNATAYPAIFARAVKHGWVNRKRDPANVGFGQGVTLPPGASVLPLAAPTAGDPHPPHNYGIAAEDPLSTARTLVDKRFSHADGARFKTWQQSSYRWESSRWLEMQPPDVRAELYDFLDRHGRAFGYGPTQPGVNKLLDALRAATHLDSTLQPPCWIAGAPLAPAAELVPCANGMLHLPSRGLIAPTPRFFNLGAVPFNFDPQAPAPAQWLQFLATVWPNDPEAIATLQELFGYLLTPDTSQQKIFLIVGPKRSGKGTIARVLTEVLGPENVAGPTLASMATPFGLQPLVGTLAAIISDARLSGRTDQKEVAENLLRISGEDRIEIGRKFLPSLTMRLGTRFVMLTNELPRIADASGAMASRFVILTMRESFIGREDPGLTSRLMGELPGILTWAVDGWHRLHARGYFVEPKSSAGAAQELADLGSPIGAFVRDECECAPDAEVEMGAMFTQWRYWCGLQGIAHSGSAQTFGRDLRAAFPSITQARPRTGGERVRVYRGVRLRGPHGPRPTPLLFPTAPNTSTITQ